MPLSQGFPTLPGRTIWARAYHNAAQTLTTAVTAALALNSERFDTDGIHDTTTNNSRLTCVTPGVYLINGQVEFVANATGERFINVRLNGSTILASVRVGTDAVASAPTRLSVTTLYSMAAGDYVELLAQQTSGGNLDVSSTANNSPEFMMVRMGP